MFTLALQLPVGYGVCAYANKHTPPEYFVLILCRHYDMPLLLECATWMLKMNGA